MDGRSQEIIKSYFEAFNQGDEDVSPEGLQEDGHGVGSGSLVLTLDALTTNSILRTAREALGIDRLEPLETYGEWPRIAVRVAIHGNRGPGHQAEGIWVFHMDEAGGIRSLWALWNPAPFLAFDR